MKALTALLLAAGGMLTAHSLSQICKARGIGSSGRALVPSRARAHTKVRVFMAQYAPA